VEELLLSVTEMGVEIAIVKLKRYKSPGSDQILTELIQAGGEILHSKIHKLILFGIGKNCLISRSLLSYQFTRRVIKLTVVIIRGYHCYQLHTKFYRNILLSRLSPYTDEITGDHQRGFQLLIRSFAFVKYWRRNGSTMRQYISYS
jgi:hypothetical protein